MQRINLVYDEKYDDADILQVPDWVAEQAYDWLMHYGEWLAAKAALTWKQKVL